jgi:hypothetical protein
MLALGAASVGAVAAGALVIIPAAGGSPSKSSCSKPAITSLSVDVTDRSAAVKFSIESSTSGEYEAVFKTSGVSGFSGTFSAGAGSFAQGVGGVMPGTHYQGTLTAQNDCGSDSSGIDFRTPKAPPPPQCSGPPTIDDLEVGSVTADAALVTYVIRSDDAATTHVLVAPGGIDISGSVAPPGGVGQAPLSGLATNTAYSVTLVARNGCGESTRQLTFTTLRPPGCVVPPSIGELGVEAIDDRSAFVFYTVHSDWIVTARLAVSLEPATRYSVALTVANDCGQAKASRTFTSEARVAVGVIGSGAVTSRPTGISCTEACVSAFEPGSTVRLTARPAPTWRFVGWGGDCTGAAPTCSLKARNETVKARFRRIPVCAKGQRPTPARACRK